MHVLGLTLTRVVGEPSKRSVLALAEGAGLTPAAGITPYSTRRAQLVARREAAELVGESLRAQPPTEPARLREALRLLGVAEEDVAIFTR